MYGLYDYKTTFIVVFDQIGFKIFKTYLCTNLAKLLIVVVFSC